jgi:hypothetical protein
MRFAPLGLGLILVFSCICMQAQTQSQKVTVTGKLTRIAAIGGESTGWAVQLDSELIVESKLIHSIELDALELATLEKYENKRVKVVGKLSHQQGVETGERATLEVSSIKEIKTK